MLFFPFASPFECGTRILRVIFAGKMPVPPFQSASLQLA
jgi:hypothetical protein